MNFFLLTKAKNGSIIKLAYTNCNKGENKMEKITLKIEGMMCQHCVSHVKKALEGVKGVAVVSVDLDTKTATVEALSSVSAATLIISSFGENGFTT